MSSDVGTAMGGRGVVVPVVLLVSWDVLWWVASEGVEVVGAAWSCWGTVVAESVVCGHEFPGVVGTASFCGSRRQMLSVVDAEG